MLNIPRFIKKIFKSDNDKELDRLKSLVVQINHNEDLVKRFKDDQFPKKTMEFKQRFKKGESLESLLPETFALVREAAFRALNERHFDVQLMGGIVLHENKIAEMKTGEGKTLVSTLPIALNALTGRGVHVITVNDYLAERDSQWMGYIFQFLKLTVGSKFFLIFFVCSRPIALLFDIILSDFAYLSISIFKFKPSSIITLT